jgi:hypothetical protein
VSREDDVSSEVLEYQSEKYQSRDGQAKFLVKACLQTSSLILSDDEPGMRRRSFQKKENVTGSYGNIRSEDLHFNFDSCLFLSNEIILQQGKTEA